MRKGQRLSAMLLALSALTAPAAATQHLVAPGKSWEDLATKVRPGDEIILMPGTHQPVTLSDVRGERDRPVIIRGLDPERPALIEANRYGIRLIDPVHVQISDVVITGATINGIALERSAPAAPSAKGTVVPGTGVRLKNVTVRETGPADSFTTVTQRHAIHVRYVSDVRLEACVVEGWAGSGVEIVGAHDVRVLRCRFEGRDDRRQISGVRARAGSRRVRITECRFRNAGDQAVCIGSGSRIEDFQPAAAEDAPAGSLFEASRVQVSASVIEGGLCAVAFVNCDRALVRNCTIVRPRRTVVSIRNEQTDPRFAPAGRCSFGSNLVTWEPGDLESLAHLGPGADLASASLEQNLWWTKDAAAAIEELGPFPGTTAFPQITDVDPRLDENLLPQTAGATSFGANPR